MRFPWLSGLLLAACNVNTTGSFGVPTTGETAGTSGQTQSSTDPTTTGTTTTTTDGTSTTDASTSAGSSSSTTDPTVDPTTGSTTGSNGGTQTTGSATDCGPLLYQVVIAVQGNDNNAEWIQIVNPCPVALDLSGYAIGWGDGDYAVGGLDLSGNLAAGECHVVGGPTSDGGNGNPSLDQAMDLNPNLGDVDYGIAIFEGGASAITPASVPIDALIYGSSNQGHLDPAGNTPGPYVGAATQGSAMIRVDATANWTIGATNPGGCPSF